jgi:hypothetical protein
MILENDIKSYAKQIISSGGWILSKFDVKKSNWGVVIDTIVFLDWNWTKLGMPETQTEGYLAWILDDENFEDIFNNLEAFFIHSQNDIIEAGKDVLHDVQDYLKKDSIVKQDAILNDKEIASKTLLFGSELLKTFEIGRYSQEIILQTLSFLFENWKDMREEEWNDPYILLEELVNDSDFPKTEESQKSDTEFCEKHREEIRAFGLALQEDLRKRGVLAG